MWTFEYNQNGTWIESAQRHQSFTFAARAATEWMTVCALNGCIVEVRLKEIK